MEINYGSVCSGIEAATLAWKPLGMRAAWFAEIEAFPSAVLAHHYPNTPNLGDMTKLGALVLADRLRRLGYEVENPADHGIVEGAQWADYMAYDLTRLGLCGMIVLPPDWERSQGARLEVLIAERLGMKVVNAHDLVSMEIAG
jgi:hypothetical protein